MFRPHGFGEKKLTQDKTNAVRAVLWLCAKSGRGMNEVGTRSWRLLTGKAAYSPDHSVLNTARSSPVDATLEKERKKKHSYFQTQTFARQKTSLQWIEACDDGGAAGFYMLFRGSGKERERREYPSRRKCAHLRGSRVPPRLCSPFPSASWQAAALGQVEVGLGLGGGEREGFDFEQLLASRVAGKKENVAPAEGDEGVTERVSGRD